MGERVRTRLTYANVMSSIAVFGVLAGGSAWAAATIGSDDIKRDAVRSKHIKNQQVKLGDLSEQYGAGVVMGRIVGLDDSAETFAGPIGDDSTDSEQDVIARWPDFEDATARVTGFTVRLTGALPPGSQRRFDLRSDGEDTGLSCIVQESTSSCTSSGVGQVDARGTASIQITSSGTPGSQAAQYGYLVLP